MSILIFAKEIWPFISVDTEEADTQEGEVASIFPEVSMINKIPHVILFPEQYISLIFNVPVLLFQVFNLIMECASLVQ